MGHSANTFTFDTLWWYFCNMTSNFQGFLLFFFYIVVLLFLIDHLHNRLISLVLNDLRTWSEMVLWKTYQKAWIQTLNKKDNESWRDHQNQAPVDLKLLTMKQRVFSLDPLTLNTCGNKTMVLFPQSILRLRWSPTVCAWNKVLEPT